MIQGNLNFSDAGGNLFYGDPAAQYKSAYKAALSLNQQNYANILKGYQQTMDEQKAAQQAVVAGYDQLQGDVLNRLSGSNAAAIQAINDRYSHDQGKAAQQLVSRGLGNTTVQSAVNRGLSLDRAKAELGAQNQLQQNIANYQTQIGMGKLGYQGSAVGQNTSLAVKQLDWMDSVKAPYPDAGAYMKVAEMKARAQPPMYPSFGPMGGGGGYPPIGGGYPPIGPGFPPGGGGGGGGWQDVGGGVLGGGGGVLRNWEDDNMDYWNSWDVATPTNAWATSAEPPLYSPSQYTPAMQTASFLGGAAGGYGSLAGLSMGMPSQAPFVPNVYDAPSSYQSYFGSGAMGARAFGAGNYGYAGAGGGWPSYSMGSF